MLDARAICETCGHTRDLHDRDAVRARLHADPPIERPCYREVGGAPCPCGGFRDSGTLVVPAGALSIQGTAPAIAIARVGLLALVLVILSLGLLYAYRSQTPSVPEVDLTKAIQDINAGEVRAVTIVESKATLEFRDSPAHREQTTLAEPDTTLVKAVADYNAAHSQQVELRVQTSGQTLGLISALLSLLPALLIFLVAAFLFYIAGSRRRA